MKTKRIDVGGAGRVTGLANLRRSRRGVLRAGVAVGAALTAAGAPGRLGRGAAAQDAAPADLSGEIVFWHGLGTEAEILNGTIVPAWQQQYPDVSIEVLQVPFNLLQNRYNTEVSAGGGPDVLLGPSDWLGQYVEGELVLPLDDLGGGEFRAGYNEAALGLFSFEDRLYAVPQNINGVALFYNKQLVPTPPTTTDEMIAMAGEVGSQPDRFGLGIFGQFYNNAGYFHAFGGEALTDQPRSGFDSAATTDWLSFLQTLSSSPGVRVGADQNEIESLFRGGQVAMMFNGPWFLQNAVAGLGAENVGVAILPALSARENAAAAPFVGGTGLYVNSNLDEEQARLAFEFARWFSTTGTQPLVDEAGQLPAATAIQVPADDPLRQTFSQQYEQGVPLPSSPRIALVWTPADAMVGAVLRGETPPDQAGPTTAATINTAIEQAEG